MAQRAKRRFTRADEKRFARLLILLIGKLGLIFCFVFLGTSHWFGQPSTTPFRLIAFGMISLLLALAGYRLVSDTWSGFSQVLHQSAAIAGLLFLAVCLSKQLSANHSPLPPAWVMVIAALAPLSWWLVARNVRRLSRQQ